jgi:hypothetical protein
MARNPKSTCRSLVQLLNAPLDGKASADRVHDVLSTFHWWRCVGTMSDQTLEIIQQNASDINKIKRLLFLTFTDQED